MYTLALLLQFDTAADLFRPRLHATASPVASTRNNMAPSLPEHCTSTFQDLLGIIEEVAAAVELIDRLLKVANGREIRSLDRRERSGSKGKGNRGKACCKAILGRKRL